MSKNASSLKQVLFSLHANRCTDCFRFFTLLKSYAKICASQNEIQIVSKIEFLLFNYKTLNFQCDKTSFTISYVINFY
jgi:hypothetical protein